MRPTNAFLETLGQYVYMFRKGELYVGKGVGDRCLHHLKEKGYSLDDCVIVARNLEKFNLDKKDASFVLESFLISQMNPRDNKVSGHYKECFIMADLSQLFGEYVDSQRNMFQEISDLILGNTDTFTNVGYTETRDTSYVVQTPMRDNIYFGIKVQTKDPEVTCYLKANNEKAFKQLNETAPKVLSEYDLDTTSNKNQINFTVADLTEAMGLWTTFSK